MIFQTSIIMVHVNLPGCSHSKVDVMKSGPIHLFPAPLRARFWTPPWTSYQGLGTPKIPTIETGNKNTKQKIHPGKNHILEPPKNGGISWYIKIEDDVSPFNWVDFFGWSAWDVVLKTLQIMGETTNLKWLAGFLNHQQSTVSWRSLAIKRDITSLDIHVYMS